MKPYYKSFIWKLYVVVVLCAVIIGCMMYLILTGADVRIRAASDPEQSEVTPTPETEITPTPEVTPEITPSGDPTPTPETTPEPTPVITVSPEPEVTPTPTPETEPSPTPETVPTPTPTPTPHIEEYDTETTESIQKVINLSHMIPQTYIPGDMRVPNVPVYGDQRMREEAAAAMEEMFAAAARDGYQLYLACGYRSYDKQMEIYESYVRDRGQKEADRIDAHPRASEHQLGLGADLCTTDGGCAFDYCFAERPEYSWLKENSWKYGYIERYPDGKESITRIKYSPWHYRYVGIDLADQLYHSGLCMEEYFEISAY
ncbi:MAG: M15 family metallopeptidase [Solobacterium sp.]|nr:M15 family metallopeptidase [Solobacterium sp.]